MEFKEAIMTVKKYTHLEIDKEVPAGISAYYVPQKEVRLKYNDREVLYVIGHAEIETACCCGGSCGPNSWKYSVVPGYLLKWQNEQSESGLPVSEVEPIADEKVRNNIRQIIQDNEGNPRIDFW